MPFDHGELVQRLPRTAYDPAERSFPVSKAESARGPSDLIRGSAYLVDELDHPAFHVIAEEVARSVDNFAPDIVLGVGGHANYLAKLWPKALRLHVECGPYSRNPYPSTMFFDHLGMHGRSVIGRFGRRIAAGAVTTEGHALVSAFRSKMALALKVSDPFKIARLSKPLRSALFAAIAGVQ